MCFTHSPYRFRRRHNNTSNDAQNKRTRSLNMSKISRTVKDHNLWTKAREPTVPQSAVTFGLWPISVTSPTIGHCFAGVPQGSSFTSSFHLNRFICFSLLYANSCFQISISRAIDRKRRCSWTSLSRCIVRWRVWVLNCIVSSWLCNVILEIWALLWIVSSLRIWYCFLSIDV